jgi:RHS repeat-associated protein
LQAYRSDTGALLFKLVTLPPAQIGGQNCNTFQNGGTTFAAADVDDDGQVEIVLPVTCVGDSSSGDRAAAIAYDPTLPEKVRVKWMTQPVTNAPESLFIPQRSIFSIARLQPNEKPVVLFGHTIASPVWGNYYCKMLLSTSTDSACRVVWAYKGEDGTLARMYYSAPADQSSLSGAYPGGHTFEGQGGYMGPVVADVEGDGAVEILYEGTLWNTDGTIKRQFDGAANTATQSSAVVELDGDAQTEIVTLDTTRGSSVPGSLKAWKADGTLLWNTPLPRGGFTNKLSVADVDRDGLPDFFFTIGGSIWVIDQSGHIKWIRNFGIAADGFAFQFGINAGGGTRLPVYDLNGDGIPEMIVQYGNNTIMFLRADTGEDQISWTYPGAPAYSSSAAYNGLIPVVADLDGSGHASVIWNYKDTNVFGTDSYLQVLRGDTVPWQPAPSHFNQAAYWESNFNADGSVPKTYTRHTTDPRTNVFGQQPQAPYAPEFVPATETSFNYSATNTAGLSSTAAVKIKIAPKNRPPVFTTKPPKTYVGPHNQINVDYLAHAVDPDPGDTITYGLVFSQGHNGVVSVEPTTGVVHLSQLFQGDQHFIISATDNHGVAAYQAFTLRMVAGMTTVPNVVGMAQADASSALSSASLSVGNITQQHNAAPVGTVLGQSPLAGTTLPQGESVDLTVSLGPLPDVTPPTVSITSPADGSRITTLTNIVGTVSNGLWRLEYSLNSDDGSPTQVWTTFASGNGPVNNAVLGTFDPTLLLNGSYTVRLVAASAAGQTSVANLSAVVTGNQKVGNFTVSFSDLQTPVAGLPIEVIRTYDSRDKRVGDFGVGWTLGLRNVRLEKSRVLGANWEQTSSGGLFSTYCIQPTKPHLVTITFPDDKVYQFEATVAPQCQLLVPIETAKISFRPTANTHGTLSIEGDNDVLVVGSVPGPVDLLRFDNADPINSKLFRLTTQEGMVFVIDQQGGVRSMSDPNGNTLTVSASGITHSSGKSISFTRDQLGRITHITDPAGNVRSYSYDANGDLVSFTDSESNTTAFTYNATHGLLTLQDPRGFQAVSNVYDAAGRLASQTDSAGKSLIFDHDLDNRVEIVTDRLGNRTRYEYDARGNTLRSVDAKGNVTSFTYDASDNVLSETDALGRRLSYTYDAADHVTSLTDAQGNVTRLTYGVRGEILTITDPAGGVTTSTYDASGNVTSTTDPLGNTTTATYTAVGLPATITDPASNVTRYEYDAFGNIVRQTNTLGNVTTFTYGSAGNRLSQSITATVGGTPQTLTVSYQYDRLNRLVKTIKSDGTASEIVYNAVGQQVATVDQLGHRTSYDYDDLGRLTRTNYPDGTREENVYDAEGRRTKSIDAAGRATTYVYDAAGRLEKTTYPDGASTVTSYDAAGQVSATTNARGNVTRFEYDAAGRRKKVIDPLGNSTTFTYDANKNQTEMTDTKGQTTRFEYDALKRRTRVVFADGTARSFSYDARGRMRSKTDQAGAQTQYEYDALGRLLKVVDALGGVTRYTYDERGRQLTQTDANNHTTSFEYDRVGRRVRRTLPLGMSESYAYDAAGRLTSRTDFRGRTTTMTYDVMGHLLSRTPDSQLGDPAVTFTYHPTGRRATMTDASGTTTYTYDVRGRLLAKQTPHGTLSYTYDAMGSLLSTRSSNADGVSVGYDYDALNRLARVSDNRLPAGTTAYSYDTNGNLQSALYPNGVRTTYAYNALNRLTGMTLEANGGALGNYAYALGPTGNRLSVTELNGRTVQYTYNALYRLTAETIVGSPNAGENGAASYTYDAVGNRLKRNSTLAALTPQSFSYDANDRPQADTLDDNGNVLASDANTYMYDFENRLSRINGGLVTYVYDGDGNRVAKTVGGVTVKYLVDTNNPTGYAQVVEELEGGVVRRAYTYGHELISQRQSAGGAWAASFYGYDGHGSVRLLTDAAGVVTDTYDYDAFGNIVARTGTTPNDYLYAGEQYDADAGFYYLRARYMNPSVGRFVSMDTFEGDVAEPASLHKYTYAENNPVNLVDRSGHFATVEPLTTVSIQNALSTAFWVTWALYMRGTFSQTDEETPPYDLDTAYTNYHMTDLFHSSKTRDEMFEWMKSFEGANTSIARPIGFAAGEGSILRWELKNGGWIFQQSFRVKVKNFKKEEGLLSVVTLGGHPLSGYRYWRVYEYGGPSDLRIETGAIDNPAPGFFSNSYSSSALKLYLGGGFVMQLWTEYMLNAQTFAGSFSGWPFEFWDWPKDEILKYARPR